MGCSRARARRCLCSGLVRLSGRRASVVEGLWALPAGLQAHRWPGCEPGAGVLRAEHSWSVLVGRGTFVVVEEAVEEQVVSDALEPLEDPNAQREISNFVRQFNGSLRRH